MSYTDRAIETLTEAESQLRKIIVKALTAKAYRELSKVAGAADSLAALIAELDAAAPSSVSLAEPASSPVIQRALTPMQAQMRPASSVAPRRKTYPQFLRDDDRLLKVAWSKKERQPYEHRAPQAVVQTLLEAVQKRKGEGHLFQAAEILPLHNANGEEYPSYQAYLALSWLRSVGVVTKKGREGYVIKTGAATPDEISRLWASLPTEE